MKDPNGLLFEAAARLLRPLLHELVFLGGSATGLLITDQAAAGVRATDDVDVITEVGSYAQYQTLSERLREIGLTEDMSDGAPMCRWRRGELIIDVMPTDASILGFGNRSEVRAFIASEIDQLLRTTSFLYALPGFLLPDTASQARLPILIERLRSLAGATSAALSHRDNMSAMATLHG